MSELNLEVARREETGKGVARRLRHSGRVPAVVYGGQKESVAISIDRKVVSEILKKSEHGVRSIFLLKMTGSDQQRHAMIKELTIHPISRHVTHIDFVRVNMTEVVKVTVPLHAVGTSKGVKNNGGILDFQVRELHVECLPNAIPDTIDIDVTELDIHDSVRIADLKIPQGVKVLDEDDRVVLTVALPRAEVAAEAAVVDPAVAEPEVLKKGKSDEDDAKK